MIAGNSAIMITLGRSSKIKNIIFQFKNGAIDLMTKTPKNFMEKVYCIIHL